MRASMQAITATFRIGGDGRSPWSNAAAKASLLASSSSIELIVLLGRSRRAAVARPGDEPRRNRRPHPPERPRRRPEPQLSLPVAASHRPDVLLRAALPLRAGDPRGGRADPPDPPRRHDLVPPA